MMLLAIGVLAGMATYSIPGKAQDAYPVYPTVAYPVSGNSTPTLTKPPSNPSASKTPAPTLPNSTLPTATATHIPFTATITLTPTISNTPGSNQFATEDSQIGGSQVTPGLTETFSSTRTLTPSHTLTPTTTATPTRASSKTPKPVVTPAPPFWSGMTFTFDGSMLALGFALPIFILSVTFLGITLFREAQKGK